MPLTPGDPVSVRTTLEEIARLAGAELRRRFTEPRSIEKKGAVDLVTDADRAAEALILKALAAAYPGVPVLAEESGPRPGAVGADFRFIVDPLDGTTNYAHGLPHFSTTVAAEDGQGVFAGVIYDPLRDELYSAVRGGGAFCNGRRLTVAPTVTLDDAVLATGFPYDLRARGDEILGFFTDLIMKARAVRRFGSAALDLAYVAQGRYDGYWERGLKAWDMAAGVLLVSEAGGIVSDYRGGPARLDVGECLAATGGLHGAMVEITRRRAGGP